VTGYYTSPVNIYNQDGSSTIYLECVEADVFVAKYDSTGTSLWATHIGGSSFEYGYGVATDSSDNILVTGNYQSTDLSIYNQDGSSTFTLPNTNSNKLNAYIVKYNTSGTALWAAYIEQVTNNVYGCGITTDSDNNVLVSGYYNTQEDLTIHNSTGGTISLTNTGTNQRIAFVVKYNPSGTAQWVTRTTGGSGQFTVNNIATS
jgi:hypothetical protein